jgi:hypothetical protein
MNDKVHYTEVRSRTIMRYASAWVKMLKWRWGGPPSTNGPIEMDLCGYNVGPRGIGKRNLGRQVSGSVQGADWWTVDM